MSNFMKNDQTPKTPQKSRICPVCGTKLSEDAKRCLRPCRPGDTTMIDYPRFDPIAIHLGPIQVRWYGLMYLIGFCSAWLLGRARAKRPGSGWTVLQVDDLVTYSVLGVVIGAPMPADWWRTASACVRPAACRSSGRTNGSPA